MISRFATRRGSLSVLGACVCLACAPFGRGTQRDAHQWLRAFCSVRFSSPHEITLINERSGRIPPRVITIVEIGGRVTEYRGDTLVLEPFYLTTIPEGGSDPITAYRNGQATFPDLALVPIEPGVAIGDFHPPHRSRSPDRIIAIVLGTGMMLTLLYTDVVLLLHL